MKLLSLLVSFLSAISLLGSAAAWTNPIRNPGGSDPFVTRSGDGYYYLLSTSWTNVQIARSTTIAGLKTATKKTIYSSSTSSRCCNVWAPEIHWINDRWILYFTAGNSADLNGQRIHVAQGGTSAWDDSYTYIGQMTPDWGIDATVLRFASYGNFLATSCFHGVSHQSICLQQLSSHGLSVSGSIYVISQPTQSWETQGNPVNEGPAALYWQGTTYLAYSASDCWTQYYCIGTLKWDGISNPTSASAWTKSSGCVFSSANGNYGTGHNSFFQSPSGNQQWLVYHATSNSGGACDDSRYTEIQLLGTHSDGSPNFGVPVPFDHTYSEPV